MSELIIIGIWGLVTILGLVAVNVTERKQWHEERKDLLNRIMSRDYREFAEASKVLEVGAKETMKVVSVAELRRDLQEDEREPLGMPV